MTPTLIRLISGGDDSAYMWEIDHLVFWCSQNNVQLNALQTIEIVVDFRENPASPHPHHTVDSYFLGTIITQNLIWERMASSRRLSRRCTSCCSWKKFNLPKPMMVNFYTAISFHPNLLHHCSESFTQVQPPGPWVEQERSWLTLSTQNKLFHTGRRLPRPKPHMTRTLINKASTDIDSTPLIDTTSFS